MNWYENVTEFTSNWNKFALAVAREQESKSTMDDAKKLAVALHSKLCTWNHTDGCSWFYEKDTFSGYARQSYLKKAESILSVVSFDEAMKVVERL